MDTERKFIEVNDHIAQLNIGPGSYVVKGADRALVVDTGYGRENHKEYVQAYTDLPLVLACTHSHFDHVRGNVFYDECFLHPADFDIYDMMFDFNQVPAEFRDLRPCRPKPINDGDVIDLGGRHIEAIHTPGHTPGSTCYLDVEARILITGDTVLHDTTWLQPVSLLDDLLEASNAILEGKTERAGTYNFGPHGGLPCYYYGDWNGPLVYREGFVFRK